MLINFLDLVLHIDKYLNVIVQEYSGTAYFFLFLIIFFETGIVATPFLPGDSLLFAAGTLAGVGVLSIKILLPVIFLAAVLGDTVNYHIGKYIGPKVFSRDDSLFFSKAHLIKAQNFYEKYGAKTIVIARFVPIIRTFAPFVAGIGLMSYKKFIFYNVIGAALWTFLLTMGGYLFGNISFVQNNYGLVIMVIIIISLLPVAKEFVVHYLDKKKENSNNGKNI
ncbi:VTT domain-containing protein [Candidatus Woesearchaeota archaeon]|nr:VTT domain-containing protein [Candidatus Woesearchaeota archaeon]